MYQTKLNDRSLRHALLLGAASAVVLGLSTPASAQVDCKANPSAPGCKAGSVETVVVTGSLIPTTNLTTTSPVTEVTAQDIHTQGVTRVEDLVNQLPQAFAAQNATVANGSSGTATVDLRGLGSSRTLVLIDGQRMPYGSPLDTSADLNEIPTQMVDRIEVQTGGSSATYGSDAIAGVVNFIMKKDYQGFQFDAQYNVFQHNNSTDQGNLRNVIAERGALNPSQFKLPPDSVWVGGGVTLSGIMGISSADGKGNVTAYFSYRHNQAVLQSSYDYSSCSIGGYNKAGFDGAGQPSAGAKAGTQFTCGGSSTSYPGRFTDFSTFDYTLNTATGQFIPWNASQDQYNYGPLNYFQRPDTRYSMGAFGHYDVNSNVQLYTQLMFTDYDTTAQIAPSGDFFVTSKINCGNPLLGASNAALIGCSPAMIAANTNTTMYIGRRNVEGGGRQDSMHYTTYRAVLGVKGELTPGWNYDVSGQYARVLLSRVYKNEMSVTRLKRALDVVNVGGVPTCQSVVDGTDPNCVPYDIFTGAGPSAAARAYLQVPLVMVGYTDLQVLHGVVTGDLGEYGIKSPWATTPVKLALGAEYRGYGLSSTPDVSFTTGDGAGQGGPTLGLTGHTSVTDLFAELQGSLVENAPMAELISLDAGYRYSTYSTSVVSNTYMVRGDWQPTDDIRFRAGFQHAVRAANVVELFTPVGVGLFNMITDPCGAGGYATLAQCTATGVPAAQFGSAALNSPAGQYNGTFGGNPNLSPEKSDTITLGAVFTPTFIDGFTASIDYFDIRLQNEITALDPTVTIAGCYQYNIAASCALIHRNGAGLLWINGGYVTATNTNIGGLKTTGVDFTANYQFDLSDVGLEGDGSLTFGMVGTYLSELITNPGAGVPAYDCAGYYGYTAAGDTCGGPNPRWRHRVRMTWLTPWDNISLAATWRYYDSVTNPSGPGVLDYRLPSMSYLDLAGDFPLANNTTLRLGVNNVMDNDPPVSLAGTSAGLGNGNTYPGTYDAMGRYLFAELTVNL